MKRQKLLLFVILGTLVATAMSLWEWYPAKTSEQRLDSVERRLNQIYRSSRTFPYRWPGAPYGKLSPGNSVPNFDDVLADLAEAERMRGHMARAVQLHARADLLAGQYNEAITNYRHGLSLGQNTTLLKQEIAIAYALRAKTEQRPLDYEYAMEQMLEAESENRSPELAFNIAVLFSQVPLPQSSIERWESVVQNEPSPEWKQEAQNRLASQQDVVQEWNTRFHHLIDSPGSYLAHAQEAGGSVELVIAKAVEEWLPNYHANAQARAALHRLADSLSNEHGDHWLKDLLRVATGLKNKEALQELATASAKNARGEHISAARYAKMAEQSFRKLKNPAGMMRARIEYIYSLDRQLHHEECLRRVNGLRQEAHDLYYTWIEGQAWLEEISCLTQTRNTEVISECERAYDWITTTKYEGLGLRALSFLTEQYFGFDSRLRIWNLGQKGLDIFWKQPLPPNRGYTFYYTIGSSARAAGAAHAALALLGEGVNTLQDSSYRQLFALSLSDLGEWEWEQGLLPEATQTFEKMDKLFDQLDQKEVKKFRQLAEMTRAELEETAGQHSIALKRLEHLIEGMPFPYTSFGPTERRRLLPLLGNVFLKTGSWRKASRHYRRAIFENRRDLHQIQDQSQRENAQREIEPAWKGQTEVYLRHHEYEAALATWENFRSGRLNSSYLREIKPPPWISFMACAFLPDGLSVWVKNANSVQQHWLNANELKRQAEKFTALASDPDSSLSELKATAKQLYREIFAPFESQIRTSNLLIVDADGPLAGIAWAALMDEQERFLSDKLAISQVIGWAEAAKHLNSARITLSRPVIFADPALGKKLRRLYPRLIDARQGAEWLKQKLSQPSFFSDVDATRPNLLDSLPHSTLFHFAGHGISNGGFGALLLAPENPELTETQVLTADEIRKLDLKELQLVVLAACSSGTGESGGGVNPDSLVRGFLQAGAFRVVATRWNVNSPETADITREFYSGILAGIRPAEALREAMRSIRRNPGTSHPYYWAGLQVFGAP